MMSDDSSLLPIRVELTDQPIDPARLIDQVTSVEAGAVVLFLGTTRCQTSGRKTESLDYEAHESMALAQLQHLVETARQQWSLTRVAVVHRLGHLRPPEASVGVAVSAEHRREAFEAARWLIDELKQVVPIWKKENWADGESEWAMPGINRPKEGEADGAC